MRLAKLLYIHKLRIKRLDDAFDKLTFRLEQLGQKEGIAFTYRLTNSWI
jgi:hypothetical protein